MTVPEFEALRDLAQLHADRTTADIMNAMTRAEHIRLTQTASEAHNLLAAILLLNPEVESEQPYGFTPTH